MGLGYDDIAAVHPAVVYVSVSGFGNHRARPPTTAGPPTPPSPSPCRASTTTAAPPGEPPIPSPVGALGDIGTALFATIGLLAALRHRDQTGVGQYVDVAMFDSMVAMTDIVVNFWSMGAWPKPGPGLPMILDGFEASNGWFIMQADASTSSSAWPTPSATPSGSTDERLATRQGWRDHMDDVLRPDVTAWAADKTNVEACFALARAGIAAGPCLTPRR